MIKKKYLLKMQKSIKKPEILINIFSKRVRYLKKKYDKKKIKKSQLKIFKKVISEIINQKIIY
jgi:hypothetical protein